MKMAAVTMMKMRWTTGIKNILNLTSAEIRTGCVPKFYSVFAQDFQNPETKRDKIKEMLGSLTKEEIMATRVKPASCVSCSVFYDEHVEKLINIILKQGKKEVAKTIVRDAFTEIKHVQLRKYNNEVDEQKKRDIILDPYEVFALALRNVTPLLGSIKIKKSGSWFNVPVGISEKDAKRKALRWILESIKDKRTNTKFSTRLAKQLLDAAQYEGKAVNKKLEFHKMCEANRGYAHYWWT